MADSIDELKRTIESMKQDMQEMEDELSTTAYLRGELNQAYALGIYKGTDGLLRNSWQQRVEQLEAENKNLQKLLNEVIRQSRHDRM